MIKKATKFITATPNKMPQIILAKFTSLTEFMLSYPAHSHRFTFAL